jgi:hypothetical protein
LGFRLASHSGIGSTGSLLGELPGAELEVSLGAPHGVELGDSLGDALGDTHLVPSSVIHYLEHLGAGRIGFSRGQGVQHTTMIVSTSGSNTIFLIMCHGRQLLLHRFSRLPLDIYHIGVQVHQEEDSV